MENKSFVAQWVYTDTVKDHFMNPRNIWKDDEDFSADGTGEVGSLACGDQMRVGIKVKDGKISDLRWLTYGCASAIASTSMMSEMAMAPMAPPMPCATKNERNSEPVAKPEPMHVAMKAPPRITALLTSILPLFKSDPHFLSNLTS